MAQTYRASQRIPGWWIGDVLLIGEGVKFVIRKAGTWTVVVTCLRSATPSACSVQDFSCRIRKRVRVLQSLQKTTLSNFSSGSQKSLYHPILISISFIYHYLNGQIHFYGNIARLIGCGLTLIEQYMIDLFHDENQLTNNLIVQKVGGVQICE